MIDARIGWAARFYETGRNDTSPLTVGLPIVVQAMVRRLIDTTGALVALIFLFWAVQRVNVETVFLGAVIAAGILYVLCYVAPKLMTRLISAPAAFHLKENVGPKAFDMQVVSYSSYHSAWLADVTHTAFFLESIAWYVLAYQFGGVAALVVLTVAKGLQLFSYDDIRFARAVGTAWLLVPALAIWIDSTMSDPRPAAMAALILIPAWRVIGHVTEPVPPGVSRDGGFVPLEDNGLTATLGLSFVVGYVAEFASGIPFRLVDFWAYDIATRAFGYVSQTHPSRSEIVSAREQIFEHGWGASTATAHLAAPATSTLVN